MTRVEAIEAAGLELAKAIHDLNLQPMATVTEMPTAKPTRRRRQVKEAA